jgi:two-component system chemotaxis sensor kinase CheA
MNSLLAQFIPEARDLIERATSGILRLESGSGGDDVINDVFRAVHTLKGSSGLFEVAPLTRLVHAAEDLLDEARSGDMELNPGIVDDLLASLDLIGGWIDALEMRERLPDDAEAESRARAAVLRARLEPEAAVAALAEPAAAVGPRGAPAWLAGLPEGKRLEAFRSASGQKLTAWSFEPEEDCFFRGDDPLATVRHSPGLLALALSRRRLPAALDSFDPLQCWLGFEAVSDVPPEAISHHFRYVAERVAIHAVTVDDLAVPSGPRAGGPVFRDFASAARQALARGDLEGLGRSVEALVRIIAPECLQASALRWLAAYLESSGVARAGEIGRLIAVIEDGAPMRAAPIAPPPETSPDDAHADAFAIEQIEALETPCAPEIEAGRFEAVARVLRGLFGMQNRDEGELETALAEFRERHDSGALRTLFRRRASEAPAPPVVKPRAEPAAAEGAGLPRVLRVDQGRIDQIMNLVAELIVAKNGLSYLADRAEREHGARGLSREIKDSYSVIDRIVQGLQQGVMAVRMMPINQVLQRFPRLVRDVSRTLGKKVDLIIEGEDTEADKNVLESLADPLIHIVRNSLDHGLEPPDERLAAGKTEHGMVKIAARNESDFVVIEVSDDGRGVDTARVRAKAVKVGIVSAERAEQMSEAEAANLIFLPGFSTKDEVSDLSGRGVGMDVVRSTVVKAGGEVALRNTPGRGSSVVIRLPLTMAVTRIVTVDCCGHLFGIPMDQIAETVRLKRAAIRRIGQAEAFVLRKAIVPIARLADRLGLVAAGSEAAEEAVMVVNLGGELVGLVVDGFRERLEAVVKPLSGILEGAKGFSGAALLGDGRVLLILDLPELI